MLELRVAATFPPWLTGCVRFLRAGDQLRLELGGSARDLMWELSWLFPDEATSIQ